MNSLILLVFANAMTSPPGQAAEPHPSFEVSLAAPAGPTLLDNREHWPEEPCFVGSVPEMGMRVALVPDAILLELAKPEAGSTVVRLAFEGASPSVEVESLDPRPGLYHYFVGNDSSMWRRNLRRYGAARCRGLYPGVDLVLRGNGSTFEYDLLVAPGASLGQVVLRCDGIESLDLDPQGRAVLHTALGPLHQSVGRCWQERPDGSLEELAFAFRRIDEQRLGFAVPGRDPGLFLTIDPGLIWSTYLGGMGGGPSLGDVARAVALDEDGFVTVVGTSEGGFEEIGQFPMTPGTFQAPSVSVFLDVTGEDVFVTRFRQSDGKLVYSSVIGGGMSHEDRAFAVDVDSSGRAAVVGSTQSSDFPTTPGAWDTVFNNTLGAFVFRLSAMGDALLYSTFLEGTNSGTEAYAVIALDSGAVVVGGYTGSTDFPTTPGVLSPMSNGFTDAFLTQIDPTGSCLEWSTFLGGTSSEQVWALTTDDSEEIFATGTTSSRDFPTTPGAFQTIFPGLFSSSQVFVCKIKADASRLVWSTLLGGTKLQIGRTVFVPKDGTVAVGGDTTSPDFPTTARSFQPSFIVGMPAGVPEAFITRLDASGSSLVYSTFLGGLGTEAVTGLAVDPSGVVSATGAVQGPFVVTPGAYDDSNGAGKNTDGFVVRLDPSGSRLYYSSRVGGTQTENLAGIAMDASGRVTLAGDTTSRDYPTTPGAFKPTSSGGGEAVVTTMDLLLRGVRSLGSSNPSCLGPVMLNATEMPVEGASGFGFYCSGAPPLASGSLVIGVPGVTRIAPLLVELEMPPPVSVIPIQSDAQGFVEVPWPIPIGTKGMRFTARCLFANTAACPGVTARSWSNGLLVTVQ